MKFMFRLIVMELITFLVIGLGLFWPAGTVAWVAGWVFMILLIGVSVAAIWLLLKYNPGLLKERMAMFKPNQAAWDKVFLVLLQIVFLAWIILMPLDSVRYRWTSMPVWLQVSGAILVLLSYYLFYLAYRANPYASATVRIQDDRGQTVVTTGPYRYVRHPLYSAGIVFFFGTAFLLGSWFGVIGAAILTIMFAARSVGEERLLKAELKGYDEYMSNVRFRFIPHIW